MKGLQRKPLGGLGGKIGGLGGKLGGPPKKLFKKPEDKDVADAKPEKKKSPIKAKKSDNGSSQKS